MLVAHGPHATWVSGPFRGRVSAPHHFSGPSAHKSAKRSDMSAILTFHSKSRVENTMEKINSGLTKKKTSKISGNVYFDGVAPTRL